MEHRPMWASGPYSVRVTCFRCGEVLVRTWQGWESWTDRKTECPGK